MMLMLCARDDAGNKVGGSCCVTSHGFGAARAATEADASIDGFSGGQDAMFGGGLCARATPVAELRSDLLISKWQLDP